MDDEWGFGIAGFILGACVGAVLVAGAWLYPLNGEYKTLKRAYTQDSLVVVNQCTKIHYLELQHIVDSTRMVDYQRYIKLMER